MTAIIVIFAFPTVLAISLLKARDILVLVDWHLITLYSMPPSEFR